MDVWSNTDLNFKPFAMVVSEFEGDLKKFGILLSVAALASSVPIFNASANQSSIKELVKKHELIGSNAMRDCMDKFSIEEEAISCSLKTAQINTEADKFTDEIEYSIFLGDPWRFPGVQFVSKSGASAVIVFGVANLDLVKPDTFKVRVGKETVLSGNIPSYEVIGDSTFILDANSSDRILQYVSKSKGENFILRIGNGSIVDTEFPAAGITEAVRDLLTINELSK